MAATKHDTNNQTNRTCKGEKETSGAGLRGIGSNQARLEQCSLPAVARSRAPVWRCMCVSCHIAFLEREHVYEVRAQQNATAPAPAEKASDARMKGSGSEEGREKESAGVSERVRVTRVRVSESAAGLSTSNCNVAAAPTSSAASSVVFN